MTTLVRAATAGDEQAWEALVDRYADLAWGIARSHRLTYADAADVCQTVWLRLVQHLHRIEDPRRIAGWIATTTRRECLRVLRRGGREEPTDEQVRLDHAPDGDLPATTLPQPGQDIIERTGHVLLWSALDGLDERCRILLRLLVSEPRPSYEEIAELLDMPIGSIGPTRMRCLAKLRADIHARGITRDILDSV